MVCVNDGCLFLLYIWKVMYDYLSVCLIRPKTKKAINFGSGNRLPLDFCFILDFLFYFEKG